MLRVVVDRRADERRLGLRLGAHLPRLLLHDVGEPRLVGDHPVAEALEPPAPPREPDRLPLLLVVPDPRDDLGDTLGRVDRDLTDQAAVSRPMDLERAPVGGSSVARCRRGALRRGGALHQWGLYSGAPCGRRNGPLLLDQGRWTIW